MPGGVANRWSNPRNDGKLMSFDLVDKDGGEIRATAWNDQVDQFQDLVQVRPVHTWTGKCLGRCTG